MTYLCIALACRSGTTELYCMESVVHGKMQLHVQNVCSIRNNNNNKPAVLTVSFFSDMEMQAESDCWRERLKAIDLCHLSFWLCLYIHYDKLFWSKIMLRMVAMWCFQLYKYDGKTLDEAENKEIGAPAHKGGIYEVSKFGSLFHWTGFCFFFIF